MTIRSMKGTLVVIAQLAVAGCAASGHVMNAATGPAFLLNRVTINNDTLTITSQHNVLELLDGRLGRFRFSINELGRSPLVVVDGVLLVDGLNVLRMLPAGDVESIRMLGPSDAVFRYGRVAGEGAIVVMTKRGFRTGTLWP